MSVIPVVTASDAFRVSEAKRAEIVAEVEEATAEVETPKFTDVAPGGTITVCGAVATAALELATRTLEPPEGAAFVSVTVAVDAFPPATLAGLSVSEDRWVPFPFVIVRVADLVTLKRVPVTDVEPSLTVSTKKLVETAPAGTVTEGGVEAILPAER